MLSAPPLTTPTVIAPRRKVRGLRILVIDDDDSLRDTIGLMLEKEGFRPLLVADGLAGLEQAYAAKPNLILVDLRMPGLGGVDVCKRLRASGATTPVIVLSAVGDEIDKVLMLEIGADDYVVKPFGTRELLVATIRIVKDLVPTFELDGSKAVYDVSGQGLPFDRFVIEQVDRKWYIAE